MIYFVFGVLFNVFVLLAFFLGGKRLAMVNPWAKFTKPGEIQIGSFAWFEEGGEQMFKDAPARSYIQLYALRDWRNSPDSRFFIRSAGKKDGVHS